ncbi:hypothetical protein NM688_g8932 [Phlebia brevispora]|uniref:Uncharacterized protein n=1 Tax=Phlebia brevispora TaxID=194682 RepID=A0ACC1RLT7_9APHY|nr:hypothetical protein NM688_g8932 [Phlebia brevispora]
MSSTLTSAVNNNLVRTTTSSRAECCVLAHVAFDMGVFVLTLSLCLALACSIFLDLPWYTCVALLAFILGLRSLAHKLRDPYGSFHIDLNRIDPAEKGEPKTEWLNMGYWKDAKSFPDACEALALKVINAAHCAPGGRVLDVGHGSGESLLLQLQHPNVPRPSELVGITSLAEHHKRALARTKLADSSSTHVTLYHGDAVYRSNKAGRDHPLSPSTSAPGFTSVVAIDCAYHFHTRRDFLVQCFATLAPGGRIALADLCFGADASGNTRGWEGTLISLLGVMPKDNIVSCDAYVCEMESIGYEDVHLEDISADVFPGFIRFLSSRGVAWRLFSQMISLLVVLGVRFVVVSGRKPL